MHGRVARRVVFPTDDARQPDYFRDLARAEDVRAVLNVPVDNLLVAKIGLYQQTIHGKPLIAGHTLRRTPQDPAVLALLDRAALGSIEGDWGTIRVENAAALLSAAGADRVIVHKTYLDEPDAALGWLSVTLGLGPPEYEDGRHAVFAIPHDDALENDDTLLLAPGFEGWSAPVKAAGQRVMFLADEGAWHLYSPTGQFGELVFGAAPYRTARPLSVSLDGQLLAAWTVSAEARLGYGFEQDAIRLPLWLEPGFHTLTFEAPDESRFPCLRLAREAAAAGGTLPAVLNAADEVAVEAFLAGAIPFAGIWRTVEQVMAAHAPRPAATREAIVEADAWARVAASERCGMRGTNKV